MQDKFIGMHFSTLSCYKLTEIIRGIYTLTNIQDGFDLAVQIKIPVEVNDAPIYSQQDSYTHDKRGCVRFAGRCRLG